MGDLSQIKVIGNGIKYLETRQEDDLPAFYELRARSSQIWTHLMRALWTNALQYLLHRWYPTISSRLFYGHWNKKRFIQLSLQRYFVSGLLNWIAWPYRAYALKASPFPSFPLTWESQCKSLDSAKTMTCNNELNLQGKRHFYKYHFQTCKHI